MLYYLQERSSNMHILGIKVSGYQMIKDGFKIDFRTKAKVDPEFEYEDEVVNLLPKIDYPRTTIFAGPNASGKTTILRLISLCMEIIVNGTATCHRYMFNSSEIDLEFVFEINGELFKYHGLLKKPNELITNNSYIDHCVFLKEELIKRSQDFKLKKDDVFSGFDEVYKTRDSFVAGTILPQSSICGILYPNDYYKKHAIHIGASRCNLKEDQIIFNRFFGIPKDIQLKLLTILDDSIEEISPVSLEKGMYSLKRHSEKAQVISFIDLLNLVSNGTFRGIVLFTHAFFALKFGSTLIVDEIELSFHSSIAGDLIFLFNDEKINKNNATLIVSTHYSDILNMLRRRDSIYICHKKNGKIDVKNMYEYDIRTELSKSNLYDNNKFDNLVNYETLMDFREAFNHEITRSRRGQ